MGSGFLCSRGANNTFQAKRAQRSRCLWNARGEWRGSRLRGPEWVKVLHCDRFEAMLTEPDTMGTVSKAEERGFDERRPPRSLSLFV